MRQKRARKASAVAEALIGLGSNWGDRAAMLEAAVDRINRLPKTRISRVSRWLETRPAGGLPGQPPFLNGAAVVETLLGPRVLLSRLQSIEKQLGRTSDQRWAPRVIDLDLLLFGSRSIQSPALSLPHPRMAWRRFVIEPAAEIAPQWVHPLIGWTLAKLRAHLDQSLPLVMITGPRPAAAAELARRLHGQRPHDTRLIVPAEDATLAAPSAHPRLSSRQLETALEQWSKTSAQFGRAAAARFAGGSDDSEVFDLCPAWIGWLRACARVSLGIQEYAEFTDRWQRAQTAGPRPRLIVAFDPPLDPAATPGAASNADPAARTGAAAEAGVSSKKRAAVEPDAIAETIAGSVGPTGERAAGTAPIDEAAGIFTDGDVDQLAPSDDFASGHHAASGDDSARSAADWPAAFWDELRRPDIGPTMVLKDISFDDALIELSAALEAMQR